MTNEERQQCYDNWQRYKWKCDDFKEDVVKFFENYKPRIQTKHGHNIKTFIPR